MKEIRDRILNVLEIYPQISPSMLQIGIGTSISAAMWKPVLDELVNEGLIECKMSVHLSAKRRQTAYTIIRLTEAGKTLVAQDEEDMVGKLTEQHTYKA